MKISIYAPYAKERFESASRCSFASCTNRRNAEVIRGPSPRRPAVQKRYRSAAGSMAIPRKLYSTRRRWDIVSAEFSPDRRNVVYRVYVRDVSKSSLSTFELFSNVDGGASVPLAVGEISDYWWAANSKEVYYGEMPQDGTFVRLMRTTAKGGTPSLVLNTEDDLYGYSSDNAGRFLARTRENMTRPPEVAIAGLSTGEVRRVERTEEAASVPPAPPVEDAEAKELFGARDLHIVDVYDVVVTGKRAVLRPRLLCREETPGFLRLRSQGQAPQPYCRRIPGLGIPRSKQQQASKSRSVLCGRCLAGSLGA
jgi:hypothetical protein